MRALRALVLGSVSLAGVSLLPAGCSNDGGGGDTSSTGGDAGLGSNPEASSGPGSGSSSGALPEGDGGAPEGAADEDGGDGGGDASSAPGFVSNIPGAPLKYVGGPPTPDLVLLSLNFLQEPSGGMVYQQWLGEVKNIGTAVHCTVAVGIMLADSSDTIIAQPSGGSFVDAAPYVPSGVTVTTSSCLAGGDIGDFYANGFANAMTDVSSIASIQVGFRPDDVPGIAPDPSAPRLSAQPIPSIGAYALQGTLTGVASQIRNIELHVYPRDASGLVLGQLLATDLGSLAPGQVFSFTTDTVNEPFTEYRAFVNYLDM